MKLSGSSVGEIAEGLARCFANGSKVEAVDLSRLDRVLEYHPEDMVVTAQGGMTLAALQTGQMRCIELKLKAIQP